VQHSDFKFDKVGAVLQREVLWMAAQASHAHRGGRK
jgi:hypothetical protein